MSDVTRAAKEIDTLRTSAQAQTDTEKESIQAPAQRGEGMMDAKDPHRIQYDEDEDGLLVDICDHCGVGRPDHNAKCPTVRTQPTTEKRG